MSDYILNALRRTARVLDSSAPLTGAWSLVLPRNNARYSILINSDSAAVVFWTLAEAAPTQTTTWLPASAPPLILSEDNMGGAITYPLWMAASATVGGLPIVSCYYQPGEFAVYERLRHELISKSPTP